MNKPAPREGFVRGLDDDAAPSPPQLTAVEATQQAAEAWPIKVRLLHRAISDGKNEGVRELSFREPTGGDINRCGCPVRIDSAGEAIIDERKMMMMMATLSGIMVPFLERMDPRDWQSCAYRLRGFFLPDLEAW